MEKGGGSGEMRWKEKRIEEVGRYLIYNNEEWRARSAYRRKNKKGRSSDGTGMRDWEKEIWERLRQEDHYLLFDYSIG